MRSAAAGRSFLNDGTENAATKHSRTLDCGDILDSKNLDGVEVPQAS